MRYFAVVALLSLFGASGMAQDGVCIKKYCEDNTVSPETVRAWHQEKDSFGPTFAGSEGWFAYMDLLERELEAIGASNIIRNPFSYRRWHTSEYPDRSGWSLRLGGESIDVANYGANSGSTGENGITAEMVLFSGDELQSAAAPPDLSGKILVLKIEATPLLSQMPDWLYAPEEFPFSVGEEIQASETIFQSTVSQLFAANFSGRLPFPEPHYLKLIKATKAAAVVVIFDMADARVRGLYAFPVPAIYDIPTLYLGREAGNVLVRKMQRHTVGTLVLEAVVENADAYQLTAVLPGRDYGTDRDQYIMMISHTDGPSISQENGPLGLISILKYFSKVPQHQRKKSLLLFLDSRHYIPLREASLPDYDIENVFAPGGPLSPKHGKIVASVHLEHLGQLEYRERGGSYEPTGRMEVGGFYVTGYRGVVDIAQQALIDHHPANQVLRSTDIKGVHQQSQGIWFGLGHHPRKLGIEAIASNMSSMGAYWSTEAGVDDFDTKQFIEQVKVMTQITAGFMDTDIEVLLAEPLGPNLKATSH